MAGSNYRYQWFISRNVELAVPYIIMQSYENSQEGCFGVLSVQLSIPGPGAQIASEVWGGRIVKIRIQAFFARKREKIFLTFFIHIPGNN